MGHSCTVASMQPLATNCPGLERLTLCSSLSMSDAEMKVIAASCPNLRRLCVKACLRVSDAGILALASGCPSLQKLKVRRCTGVSQAALDFLQEQRPDLSITQESTAGPNDARRARAAAEAAEAQGGAGMGAGARGAPGPGGVPGGVGGVPGVAGVGAPGRIFDERDDLDFEIPRMMRQAVRDARDESPEVLRRLGTFGAGGNGVDALGRSRGATRARLAQVSFSISRAFRSLIGQPGQGQPGINGIPSSRPDTPPRTPDQREG